MKFYRNNKIFDYEHYKSESSSLKLFQKMLSFFTYFFAFIAIVLFLFLFLSPSSNNSILKDSKNNKISEVHILQ